MTLAELITDWRSIMDDTDTTNPLWTATEGKRYANKAEEAICRMTRMLKDGFTSTETVATGTIQLAGTAGSIDSVKVNGITITSAAVSFTSTLAGTATALAANITAYTSSPNYTAAAGLLGALTISAAAGSASTPNEYVVTVTCSGGLSATVTNMANGTALTRLTVISGQGSYQLDSRIIDIEDEGLRLLTLDKMLSKCSYVDFQSKNTLWDTLTGEPNFFCIDHRRRWLTFDFIPTAADTAYLRTIRMPLVSMSADTDTPEIPDEYHGFIPDMMAYFAYHKNDSECLDQNAIERYFMMCFDEANPKSHIERIKRMENQNNRTSRKGSATQMMHPGLL
jgi:hypothetical protein